MVKATKHSLIIFYVDLSEDYKNLEIIFECHVICISSFINYCPIIKKYIFLQQT